MDKEIDYNNFFNYVSLHYLSRRRTWYTSSYGAVLPNPILLSSIREWWRAFTLGRVAWTISNVWTLNCLRKPEKETASNRWTSCDFTCVASNYCVKGL